VLQVLSLWQWFALFLWSFFCRSSLARACFADCSFLRTYNELPCAIYTTFPLLLHAQARAENLERYRIIAEEEEERRLEQEQEEANARREAANAKKAELRALQEVNMERWKAKESFRELNGDNDDDDDEAASPKQSSKSEAARAKVGLE